MPVKKGKGLLYVLDKHSPQQMSNGQIRMECPFRENHTDGSGEMSFFLTPDINAYHCFSCRAHGSIIRLITTQFGVNYFEAVEMVRLGDYTPEKHEFELDIMWDIKPPQSFLDRGFSEETLKHFRLGVAQIEKPDGRGKTEWTIIPFFFDGELKWYQQRIDGKDRIVVNYKGFDKFHYLYNLDTSYDYVIVTEGYSDVMRLYQHGYNSTAVLGADASDWQAKEISKFENVYLAFDNDDAGRRATEILYHQIKNSPCKIKIIPYTTKDPGSCTSKKEWSRAFNSATSYMEYSMEMSMGFDDYLDMKEQVLKDLEKRKHL